MWMMLGCESWAASLAWSMNMLTKSALSPMWGRIFLMATVFWKPSTPRIRAFQTSAMPPTAIFSWSVYWPKRSPGCCPSTTWMRWVVARSGGTGAAAGAGAGAAIGAGAAGGGGGAGATGVGRGAAAAGTGGGGDVGAMGAIGAIGAIGDGAGGRTGATVATGATGGRGAAGTAVAAGATGAGAGGAGGVTRGA